MKTGVPLSVDTSNRCHLLGIDVGDTRTPTAAGDVTLGECSTGVRTIGSVENRLGVGGMLGPLPAARGCVEPK